MKFSESNQTGEENGGFDVPYVLFFHNRIPWIKLLVSKLVFYVYGFSSHDCLGCINLD